MGDLKPGGGHTDGGPGALTRLALAARRHFHERRADLFVGLMHPEPGMRVLDLGSGWGDPLMARVARRVPVRVTLADVTDGPREDAERLGFEAVVLDEGTPLPFADREFDIVLSNSVIEHVTLPKADCVGLRLPEPEWIRRASMAQCAFAEEIRRVGRRYFVQTPHRHFPLDLHLWLPFTNWLSHAALQDLVPITDRYWVKNVGAADWRLLDAVEMKALFPDASIVVERLAGLPKSVTAYT